MVTSATFCASHRYPFLILLVTLKLVPPESYIFSENHWLVGVEISHITALPKEKANKTQYYLNLALFQLSDVFPACFIITYTQNISVIVVLVCNVKCLIYCKEKLNRYLQGYREFQLTFISISHKSLLSDHRITKWLRLDGTSGSPLVQPP